jgi:hypothetical protein
VCGDIAGGHLFRIQRDHGLVDARQSPPVLRGDVGLEGAGPVAWHLDLGL